MAPIVQSFQDKTKDEQEFGLGMRLGLGLALLAISWGARALRECVQLPRELREEKRRQGLLLNVFVPSNSVPEFVTKVPLI